MARIGKWFCDSYESEKDRVCGGDRNDKRSPNKTWEETKVETQEAQNKTFSQEE